MVKRFRVGSWRGSFNPRAEIESHGADAKVPSLEPGRIALAEQGGLFDLPLHGRRVLEIGCASGIYSFLVATRYTDPFIVGTDICFTRMNLLPKAAAPRPLHGVCADLYHLPFRPGSFDCVIGVFILHHLPRPWEPLAELRRLLAPGGRYWGIEPNALNPWVWWLHVVDRDRTPNEWIPFPWRVRRAFQKARFGETRLSPFWRRTSAGRLWPVGTCFSITACAQPEAPAPGNWEK